MGAVCRSQDTPMVVESLAWQKLSWEAGVAHCDFLFLKGGFYKGNNGK